MHRVLGHPLREQPAWNGITSAELLKPLETDCLAPSVRDQDTSFLSPSARASAPRRSVCALHANASYAISLPSASVSARRRASHAALNWVTSAGDSRVRSTSETATWRR